MKATQTTAAPFLRASCIFLGFFITAANAQPSMPEPTSRPVIPLQEPAPGTPATHAKARAIDTTIADIMRRPDDYAGRYVTVTSEVEQVFTPWSFKLEESQAFAGGIDNDLLVVGAEPLVSMGFRPSWRDKKISVTGTIRLLDGVDFRREYGRGVDDKLFRRYEGKPALIPVSMKIIGDAK